MSGKGSGRRPQKIPDAEAQANWERIFGKKAEEPQQDGPEPDDKESHDGGC
jgi:hypothetical protein